MHLLHLLVLLELLVIVCVHLDLDVGQVFIRLPQHFILQLLRDFINEFVPKF